MECGGWESADGGNRSRRCRRLRWWREEEGSCSCSRGHHRSTTAGSDTTSTATTTAIRRCSGTESYTPRRKTSATVVGGGWRCCRSKTATSASDCTCGLGWIAKDGVVVHAVVACSSTKHWHWTCSQGCWNTVNKINNLSGYTPTNVCVDRLFRMRETRILTVYSEAQRFWSPLEKKSSPSMHP